MKKLKILTVFGTRPEVIKLAPFIKAVEEAPDCISITCATTQHRELQNDILSLFQIKPDYDLDIMIDGQDLFHITTKILEGTKTIIESEKPDIIVVQGDTTTTFTAALAAFYNKIPVVHIEAGLRTGNYYSPFPEEANRSLISKIATLHMAPTQKAVINLNNEGIFKNVFLVGNTIIDSVHWALDSCVIQNESIKETIKSPGDKILITVHRRENFFEPLQNICSAIEELCRLHPTYKFIWPLHPNPNVKRTVYANLQEIPNLFLIEALPYSDLLHLINASSLILSDSGGIQEEACILGKRIIVLREITERMEVIETGMGVLVGSDKEKICRNFNRIIQGSDILNKKDTMGLYGFPGVSKDVLLKIKEHFNMGTE